MTVMERVIKCAIVPVIVLDEVSRAVPTAKALLAGGIDVMEITFRTAAARDAIAEVVANVPEMLVGAGTVINLEQMETALSAGAQFIVSPGTDDSLIATCMTRNVPILPGVVSPSEIMIGLKHGLRIFKFFPSESYGGLATIKALSGPFPNIKFLPTGGISEKNAADYLANPSIAAIGGSWMVPAKLINNENYAEITEKAAIAATLARRARKGI